MNDEPADTAGQTPLDLAHAAMEADPNNTTARLAWFDRLAGSEMFLLLEAEATEDSVKPKVFTVDGADLVVGFDLEERLSDFAGEAAPYVALSGRTLAGMLSSAGLGLALNLGTSAETVLEADAVAWLAGTVAHMPETVEDRPDEVLPPDGLPDTLLTALDARLAAAEGRATLAYLVATRRDDGRRGHLLGFVGALPGAEGALAQLVGEALTFSGLDAASLDVAFFEASDPICAPLSRVGLRFDLPEMVEPPARAAPGSDPAKPPRLR